MKNDDETIGLDLEFIDQTELAYLVSDGDSDFFLPKSQVSVDFPDDVLKEGTAYLFELPEWLAYKMNLV